MLYTRENYATRETISDYRICDFCQRPSHVSLLACGLCKKTFPLPKLVFGTKNECIQKLAFWALFNVTVPPVLMTMFWGFYTFQGVAALKFYPFGVAVWASFIAATMLFKWLMGDDESIAMVCNRSIQVTGYERYNYIGLQFWSEIVMWPFGKMVDAFHDLKRHY